MSWSSCGRHWLGGLSQERNTALTALNSCSLGSAGEVLTHSALYSALNSGQLFQVVGGQLGVLIDALSSPSFVDELFSKYFLPTSMTTSENIWMKRR